MNFDLPIEQLVRRTDTRFQLGFATRAKRRICAGDAFALSASRRGLHVLASGREGGMSDLIMVSAADTEQSATGSPVRICVAGCPASWRCAAAPQVPAP
jgi:hypothetical protein